MITNRDAAIQAIAEALAAVPDADWPKRLDDLRPLAAVAVDALGYPSATPRPGDTLTRKQLNDLPPGSLIRNEYDGYILERTANDWRWGREYVSLADGRPYTLIWLKDHSAPRTADHGARGLGIGSRVRVPGNAVEVVHEVEVTGFEPNGVIRTRRVSSDG